MTDSTELNDEDYVIEAEFSLSIDNTDHSLLLNRDIANQHPISAITGLQSALDGKQPVGDYATTTQLNAETQARTQADTTLQGNITAEATTRASADASLSTAIDVETTDRQTADSQLQDNITNEATARQNADTNLQTQINGKQPNLTSANAGTGISITGSGSNVVISNTQTSAEWGNITGTLSNQTDLQNALNAKQSTISDLDTIRANATAGKNASTTIATYGNIVTHNTSEFATSAQGTKADSALQPNDVINDVTHTDTQKPLSANMGKELQDQITNLKQRGRYLSIWNCATGLATTTPTVNPYTYKAGDYFIVGVVASGSGTNYRPNGATYDKDVPSTTVETGTVIPNDTYYYDGTNWTLLHTEQPTVAFSTLAGSPYDNTNLTTALNAKQNTIDSTHKLSADLVDDSTTTNKFVTAQDKTNWNNKVDKNNAITAGTKCKITYDTKGLVTGGSNLTASDIPDLSATYYSASNPSGYQTASQVNTAVTSYHDNTKQDVIDSSHKLSADLVSDGTTNKVVTQTEKNTWNNKQDALGYTPENSANKVTSISSSSTNTQYPSAKCVYDIVGNVEALLQALR